MTGTREACTSTSANLPSVIDDQHFTAHLVAVLLAMDVAPEDLIHVLKLFRILRNIKCQPDHSSRIYPYPGCVRQLHEHPVAIERKGDVEQHGGHELMGHRIFVPEHDIGSRSRQQHKSFCR